MTTEDIRKYLVQVKFVFGLGLVGLFSIMKMVFDYQHISMGIGYIALIIGIGNVIWTIYDYIALKKIEKNEK
jgi:uncharacterized membrane protein